MKRLRTALPALLAVAVTLALAGVLPAAGQEPWRLVQGPDGVMFVIRGDVKNRIVPTAMTETEMAITEAPPWEDGVMLAAPADPAIQPAAAPKPERANTFNAGPSPRSDLAPPPRSAEPKPTEPPAPPPVAEPARPQAAAPPPPPPAEKITLSGNTSQNTRPFDLRGGHYTVTWETRLQRGQTSCYSGASLRRVESGRQVELLYNLTLSERDGRTSASGENQVYSVAAGQYFLDVSETGCSWSVTLRPQ
jgi:hypothetical protein